MPNLLRFQIYKLFHNTIFWAGAGLTICSVVFYAVFESMKAETVANGMPLFQYYSILFQNYSTGLPILIFCVVFASDDFMSGAVHLAGGMGGLYQPGVGGRRSACIGRSPQLQAPGH